YIYRLIYLIRVIIRARVAMLQEVEKMKESRIERHLVDGVKKLGGMCIKFTSPGTPGVPDRIILTADGRIIFVELKTETGRLAKIQRYVIGELQKRGADVRVVKGLDEVKALLAEIEGSDAQ
ncbi:MAG: VRR-NUC domain-containing protein, partial [Ruminococcus sp.]|nr:VRR-NUC domain-containing protein [Ruminococcus sp.]